METLRINALALYLGVGVEELNVSAYDDNVIEYGNQEYLVVTDDEAWKSDARYDGRAHSLARYDGNEDEITVYQYSDDRGVYCYTDGADEGLCQTHSFEYETFYIYRQN